MKTYILPTKLRRELKSVWGIPIFGGKRTVAKKFKKISSEKKFKKIVTVGDYCSLFIPSDIKIFDGKIRRKKVKNILRFSLQVSNPSGTIQRNSWPILAKAIRQKLNVFVKGEEDLLVIPAVLLSGNHSAVVYGIPGKGICLIMVNPAIKKELKELLKRFRIN